MRKIAERVKTGDLVLTYDFRLTQVTGLEVKCINKKVLVTGVMLNTGEVVEPYEIVKVHWIGSNAKKVMKELGRCEVSND